MDLQYEPAGTEDIESIFQANQSMIDQYENIEQIDYQRVLAWVRRKIETHIAEYARVLEAGTPVGYCYCHETAGQMEIDDLWISPPYRNRGIGTEIIRKCIGGTSLPVMLYVFIRNTKAVALYQRLGFQIVENIKDSRYIMVRRNG